MRTIDLKKIIEHEKLDKKEIATHLFPGNKHPDLALNRVMNSDAVLDANQISKLALLLNVSISDLFDQCWKGSVNEGAVILTSDDFKAVLDIDGGVSRIFHKSTLFHEMILHPKTIALSEYIKQLDLITKNHKSNE